MLNIVKTMLLKVPGPSQMEAALTALPHTAPSWWKFAGKFCRVPDISVLQDIAENQPVIPPVPCKQFSLFICTVDQQLFIY